MSRRSHIGLHKRPLSTWTQLTISGLERSHTYKSFLCSNPNDPTTNVHPGFFVIRLIPKKCFINNSKCEIGLYIYIYIFVFQLVFINDFIEKKGIFFYKEASEALNQRCHHVC